MPGPRNPRPHIWLPDERTITRDYKPPSGGGGSFVVPQQKRSVHAGKLRGDLARVERILEGVKAEQQADEWVSGFGLPVCFKSFPDVELTLDSLDLRSHGIELLNVQKKDQETLATAWIPDGKLGVFESKIKDYIARKKDVNGNARDNRKQIDAIREIRAAVIRDLWVAGPNDPLPPDDQIVRLEAWLATPKLPIPTKKIIKRSKSNRQSQTPIEIRTRRFQYAIEKAGLETGKEVLVFPEHIVFHVRGTIGQLRDALPRLGQLAELRPSPETAKFFMSLGNADQVEWSDDLLVRTQLPVEASDVPHICILDTGGYLGHPLLTALAQNDLHSADPSWGVDDQDGHGTLQAGIALWGDLSHVLSSRISIHLEHRLESVKLLRGNNTNEERHYAILTRNAISRPEISYPKRKRVYSLAVTAPASLPGRPTAWSAEIDALASDWAGDGSLPRLIIVSGGNVEPQRLQYPQLNETSSIQEPAQAWNAITVGALTHKSQVDDRAADQYTTLAKAGTLSPFSSTSALWDREAPFKPDVVFEGGNAAEDSQIVSTFDSLSLLSTTHAHPRLFDISHGTSPATALASRFAAQLMVRYPDYWPETVRALMVHGADWPESLKQQFGNGMTKEDVEQLLRRCGWGEPDFDKASFSGSDLINLVAQREIQPFKKGSDKSIRSKDVQLHELPWPKRLLQGLGNLEVELRVTLSYFIEPSPGERGRRSRYRYASHGLRFLVQKPEEGRMEFKRRVTDLMQEDGEETDNIASQFTPASDPNWMLGLRRRVRGSLHHDRWTGHAVDLASRRHIAIYPTGGWWKTRELQNRYARKARYALVVSIHAPNLAAEIDLYAETQLEIKQYVPIKIPISVDNEL